MENVRYNISPCEQSEVKAFISKIDPSVYTPNGTVSATEKSHYDRYSYLRDDCRIAIVYDTYAHIVSVTGRADFAEQLLSLFGTQQKSVKKSTVPAQGAVPVRAEYGPRSRDNSGEFASELRAQGSRAKLFVTPDSIKRRAEFTPVPTVFASAKGAIISTDEIFPPQTVKKRAPREQTTVNRTYGNIDIASPEIKRVPPPYYETSAAKLYENRSAVNTAKPITRTVENDKAAGISISLGRTPSATPRRATISFGTEDGDGGKSGEFKINTRVQPAQQTVDNQSEPQEKRKRGRPPKNKDGVLPAASVAPAQQEKRKRGRPPKAKPPQEATEADNKNGYAVKNLKAEVLAGVIKQLRLGGLSVMVDGTEFGGTPQEVRSYTVSDLSGQKAVMRYATKRMTLQVQGKQSELLNAVIEQLNGIAAAEQTAPAVRAETNAKPDKLKLRLPTAYDFLSEQSRTDFSYALRDFEQKGLQLSDYSVLLVPAFRGLERFVFDLQRAEGIDVKMIGQAYDKDDTGKYVLKSGYSRRIGSVVYAEVMVALYSEYFTQRNFFAHSDNTGKNISRSIAERSTALGIFDHILDVVEYNAKKLKEIGFDVNKNS